MAADLVAPAITHVISKLNYCVYPQDWKKANIINLLKDKKQPSLVKNSHPISLLTTVGKIMENIVYTQVNCYFSSYRLFIPDQHAY